MFDGSDPDHLAILRERLSVPRLAPYDMAVGGSLTRSLALYEWNTRAAAAFYASLQGLEVVLRNALDRALTSWHSTGGRTARWYDDPTSVLGDHRLKDIDEARRRIRRQGYQVSPSRVVAELNFGFWRYLLTARYERTLWTPALRHAFPGLRPQRRGAVAGPVADLHQLRNRIAHHEPIHRRDLDADYQCLLFVAGAICSRARGWIEETSTVPAVLARRPN